MNFENLKPCVLIRYYTFEPLDVLRYIVIDVFNSHVINSVLLFSIYHAFDSEQITIIYTTDYYYVKQYVCGKYKVVLPGCMTSIHSHKYVFYDMSMKSITMSMNCFGLPVCVYYTAICYRVKNCLNETPFQLFEFRNSKKSQSNRSPKNVRFVKQELYSCSIGSFQTENTLWLHVSILSTLKSRINCSFD